LIDVMQGYPYFSIQAALGTSDMQTAFGNGSRDQAMQSAVMTSAAIKLAAEAETALLKLRLDMTQKLLAATGQ